MSNEEEVRSKAVVIVKKYFRIFVVCLLTFMLIGCNGQNDLPGGPSEGGWQHAKYRLQVQR
jgi:hypothetical protein